MKKDFCIHYNGIGMFPGKTAKLCDANHNYLDVARPVNSDELKWHNENYPNQDPKRTALSNRVPCCVRNGLSDRCPDFRLPTPEEIKGFEEWITMRLNRVNIAYKAVKDHLESQGLIGKGARGEVLCPICKTGKLAFGYAGSYNGHIHGKCNTAGCVEWME